MSLEFKGKVYPRQNIKIGLTEHSEKETNITLKIGSEELTNSIRFPLHLIDKESMEMNFRARMSVVPKEYLLSVNDIFNILKGIITAQVHFDTIKELERV